MKYSKLVKHIQKELESEGKGKVKQELISDILDKLFSYIKDNVKKGNNVSIKEFGSFRVREVKGGERKIGNNNVKIKAFRTISFKPSKEVRF